MKSLSLSRFAGQPRPRHDDRSRPHRRSFPKTDYRFQAQAEDVTAVRAHRTTAAPAELRAFRKISSDYLSEETHRGYLVEMALYALVTGLIAWPLVSLLIVLAQTARG